MWASRSNSKERDYQKLQALCSPLEDIAGAEIHTCLLLSRSQLGLHHPGQPCLTLRLGGETVFSQRTQEGPGPSASHPPPGQENVPLLASNTRRNRRLGEEQEACKPAQLSLKRIRPKRVGGLSWTAACWASPGHSNSLLLGGARLTVYEGISYIK